MSHQPNFCLFDAARSGVDNLEAARKQVSAVLSLYQGSPEEDSLASVAPYLLELSSSEDALGFFVDEGWGQAWGVLLSANVSLQQLKKHFAKFLVERDEAGREVYFRFYDPRVLKVFLPDCDPRQVIDFFGPVEVFLVEGDTRGETFRYSHEKGTLKITKLEYSIKKC